MENMQNMTEAVKNTTKTITTGKLVGGGLACFGGGILTCVAGCKLVKWIRNKIRKNRESKVESKPEEKKPAATEEAQS